MYIFINEEILNLDNLQHITKNEKENTINFTFLKDTKPYYYSISYENNKIDPNAKETEENKFYKLASFSDVIDISYILGNYPRFDRPISIDFPCQGIIRFFPRYSDKIIVPFTFCSSFEIKVKDKNI